jgi:hypothetical protein
MKTVYNNHLRSEISEPETPEIKYADTPIYSRFLCWTCGLYQNEYDICLNCVKFNSWADSKIKSNVMKKR